MPFFVMLFVVAFSFYLFYKIKFVRSKQPVERKWISAKSSIALGSFVALFGLNQFFVNQATITYVVGTIFIILGALNVWGGIKSYRFYLPQAIEEANQLNS